MLENERIVKARKRNMKLYPLYRMVGVDIVFLYAIKMLFLTQVNGINASNVILSVSMYALFMVILQVPATMLIEKIGYRKSAFISNVFNVIYIALLMVSTNLWWLILAEFTSAVTFSLKDVAEPSLLSASIPETDKRGNIYSKLEGKGKARYNYLDGIANIISGAVYVINPYLPIILALVFAIFACILSLQFEEIKDIEKQKEAKKENIVKEYLNDMKVSFKFILKSKRLRGLLLFSGIMWAVVCLVSEYKDTILVEIGTSPMVIGIVGSILGIVSAISSKKQVEFHNKFKNRTLTYIGISFVISIILSGLIVTLKVPFIIELVMVVLAFIVINADNSMSLILIDRYLGNFTDNNILPKIYSAKSIVKNIFRMIVGILGSILMAHTGSANAMLIVGIISLVVIVTLLKYMKTRVGLKPEEYKTEDIKLETIEDSVK